MELISISHVTVFFLSIENKNIAPPKMYSILFP